MLKFNKILRDPDPTDSGEVTPPAATPPVTPPPVLPLPKNKEEWDKLAQEDPQRWIKLTQARRYFRIHHFEQVYGARIR